MFKAHGHTMIGENDIRFQLYKQNIDKAKLKMYNMELSHSAYTRESTQAADTGEGPAIGGIKWV